MMIAMEKYKTRPPGASGFTIIEVLLALVVFSIGMLAVAGMQTSSVTENTVSKMNTMAVSYASEYMESLLGLGTGKDLADPLGTYSQLKAGGPYAPVDFAGVDDDGDHKADLPYQEDKAKMFDLTWTVTDMPSGSGLPGEQTVKRIDLTVTWANGNRRIVLTSVKSGLL